MTKDNNLLGTFKLEGIPPAPRGIPQIEVAFDLDANGIMKVEASDKGSGKKEDITIKNDKGRLSAEDIEKMVEEAEKFKDEDNKIKETIDAKNEFEGLLYQTKATIEKKEMKEKLEESDLETLTGLVKENEEWLNENMEATKEEFNSKRDEFNTTVQPIMTKLYGDMSKGMPGGMPDMSNIPEENESENPTIDEID